MVKEGQIILFRFPQTNLENGKLRPALIVRKTIGNYNDWLICMISSRLHQAQNQIDECIDTEDIDFSSSGLKIASIVRGSRLAVVEKATACESIF